MNKQEQTESSTKKEVAHLFNYLDEHYVGVLGMRSIGALQWTKSPKIKHDMKDKNYTESCKRAEIISELIKNDKIDQHLYVEYHKAVVRPYLFVKRDNGEIQFLNEAETNARKEPILKCPERIVEAEQVALLLSYKDYLTITLEEPDRGMHTQMVVKLRDCVFKKVKDRVVIVISHNQAILDRLTIDQTYMTAKDLHKNQISHSVMKFPKGYKNTVKLKK